MKRFGAFLGVALAAVLAVAAAVALSRREAPRPAAAVAQPAAPAAEPATVVAYVEPDAPAKRTLNREALTAILRELARLREANDGVGFGALAQNTIEEWGADLVGPLAAYLRDDGATDEAGIAAWLLGEVASAADMPVVIELLAREISDPVAEALFGIALRLDPRAAEEAATAVLLAAGRSDQIRATAAALLGAAATPTAISTLELALRAPDAASIQRPVAEALASIRSPAAASALLSVWVDAFDGSTDGARDKYFLLRALGTMGAEVAGDVVLGFLSTEADPSRRNLVLSVTPLLGAEFALGIVTKVLEVETVAQVREQAILILGAIDTAEAHGKLVELLISPRDAGDLVAAANALFQQANVKIEFGALRRGFEGQPDGVAKAVLTVLLARDPLALKGDAAFLTGVWETVRRGLRSTEPLVQYFSLTAYALLAGVVEKPVEHVRAVMEQLSAAQVNQFPVLTEVLAEHSDETAAPVWREILGNKEFASYHRLRAAEQLLKLGDRERVWQALREEPDPGVKVLMADMLVAEEGPEGAERMSQVAAEQEDPDTRETMEHHVEVWNEIHHNQAIQQDP